MTMNEPLARAARYALAYPTVAHVRRHGPRGYADYRAFKPWLRDEFTFRCVYCLTRERWWPSGWEEFAVEHYMPQSAAPDRIGDYENLLYACSSCNRNRQDTTIPLDPATQPLGAHLRLTTDGTVDALTKEGRVLLRVCHLNRPLLVQFRLRLLALIDRLTTPLSAKNEVVLLSVLGFPDDLPDLAAKRPPGGNTRPDGIAASFFEQKRRGELAEGY